MALIKCQECGKEFSDKAGACIHCGCPIGKEEKKIFCVDCGNELKATDKVCNKCGCPIESKKTKIDDSKVIKSILDEKLIKKNAKIKMVIILGVFFLLGAILGNATAYEDYFNGTHFGTLGFITWGVGIIAIILNHIQMKNYLKQELVVDSEKVYGKVNVWFHIVDISIPLKQVSSISTVMSSIPFEPTRLAIASSSGRYLVGYILNQDEIKNNLLSKLEK